MLDQPPAQEPSTPYYPPANSSLPDESILKAGGVRASRQETSALVMRIAELARLMVSPQPIPQVALAALTVSLALVPEARSLRLIALTDDRHGGSCQLAAITRAEAASQSESTVVPDPPHPLHSLGLGAEAERQLLVFGRNVSVESRRGVPLRDASGRPRGAVLVDFAHPELPPISAHAWSIVCDHLAVLLARYHEESATTQADGAVRDVLHALDVQSGTHARGLESASQATQAYEEHLLRGLARSLEALSGSEIALALLPDANGQLRMLDVESRDHVLSKEESHQMVAGILALGTGDTADVSTAHPLWPLLVSARHRARGRGRADLQRALLIPVQAGASRIGAVALLSWGNLRSEEWLPLARALCAAAGERIHAGRTEAAAEARASANDAFLSLMAHELRSPLTSVKGYAQLLIRQARRHALPDSVMRSTESIEQQAARISEMIDELHDASRIRRDRLELLLGPVDLVPIVRQQIERWTKLAPEHSFSLEIEADSLVGEWDAHRVTQMVRDLLDNATRFSPAGGAVEVRLRREGDNALFSVRDHGIGIPPEERERIYEYLYRVSAAEGRNLSGLGLGLFVSGVVAQRLGGRLWLEWSQSGEDGGSEFQLALPLSPSEEML